MKSHINHIGVFIAISAMLFGCAQTPMPPSENTNSQTQTEVKTTIVKVYFSNPDLDPNKDFVCHNVFAVERKIPKTETIALASIQELLKGPTDSEKTKGYTTNINEKVKVQKLTIENSTARIDFNNQLEYQVGGSCRITAIIAQITQTLKQFPTVKDVIISIDGRTEDILQP